jgi:hypothetical protein
MMIKVDEREHECAQQSKPVTARNRAAERQTYAEKDGFLT